MEIGSAAATFAVPTALAQTSGTSVRPQAEAADSRTYHRAMDTTASAASNVLATNFVTTDSASSKYIKATISSLQTQNSFGDRMGSLLDGLSAQYSLLASSTQVSSGNGTYVAATLMQRRVEDGVQRTTEDTVAEASTKNLDDLKEDIEQRAEEATQPQDAASQTGQDATTNGAATSAAAANTSPAETADAGQQSTASPDTPAGGAPAAAVAETVSPTTGESAAPLSPSSPGMSGNAAVTALPMAAYATQQATRTPPETASVDKLV